MQDILDRLKAALADRYTVERELGAGGMATVFLAEDLKHNREVAVKVLRPELAAVIGPERFIREIEIAARLSHPHIVPLHDSGSADGFLYYVMPFVAGESLREKLNRERHLAIDDAIRITHQIASALDYAHRHGVIHRDIKPENIMMHEGEAMVTDFGIARAVTAAGGSKITETGLSLGTPQYMSPEQASAEPDVDGRSDIYALGCVLYEMLAGEPPFTGPTAQAVIAKHTLDTVPPVRTTRPTVSVELEEAITRALAKVPADRFTSAADFGAAVALASGNEVSQAGAIPKRAASDLGLPPRVRRLNTAIVAVAVAAVIIWVVGTQIQGAADVRWVREVAIPEIQSLNAAGSTAVAYRTATRAREILADDPVLEEVWQQLTEPLTLHTTPSGADVRWTDYDPDVTEWFPLGTTPLDSVSFPTGVYRLRIEIDGYSPLEVLNSALQVRLVGPADDAEGMVWVPGGSFDVEMPGLQHLPVISLGPFLIDRYEVTNAQYQEFVDAGGYAEREYWDHAFEEAGGGIIWEEAVARFTDGTDRRGPATWEGGNFPSGQAEYPVTGVSWYEAAAYARFVGKELPTIYHWSRTAAPGHVIDHDLRRLSAVMVPNSNVGAPGPVPAHARSGVGVFGTHHMAGNVREWCWNDAGDGKRYLLGGGWNQPAYGFTYPEAADRFDRSPTNGIRLVRYPEADSNLHHARRTITQPQRDFSSEQPVSDREFEIYRRLYLYDRTPLNAVVESSDSSGDWIEETIAFDAAYGGERMSAILFTPNRRAPPYQTAVLFPGASAIFQRSTDEFKGHSHIDFIVRSGRAVMLPVLKGTWDRGDALNSDLPDETAFWRDHVIQWVKDVGRSIDYLETRDDIDSEKLAFYGTSWGAEMGIIVAAVETRFKAAVFFLGGLSMQLAQPEVAGINYLSRINIPVLMLNGRYDNYYPVETSQEPMFELLGTPPEQKRHRIYDCCGHDFGFRAQRVRETLNWLDRYLGPVR